MWSSSPPAVSVAPDATGDGRRGKAKEEARSYQFYLENVKIGGKALDEQELAFRVGKDIRYVKNRLKLNKIVDEAQKDLEEESLPIGLALELARYSPETQIRAYQFCFEKEWIDGEQKADKQKPVSVKARLTTPTKRM